MMCVNLQSTEDLIRKQKNEIRGNLFSVPVFKLVHQSSVFGTGLRLGLGLELIPFVLLVLKSSDSHWNSSLWTITPKTSQSPYFLMVNILLVLFVQRLRLIYIIRTKLRWWCYYSYSHILHIITHIYFFIALLKTT
jgi:hypothetical protein